MTAVILPTFVFRWSTAHHVNDEYNPLEDINQGNLCGRLTRHYWFVVTIDEDFDVWLPPSTAGTIDFRQVEMEPAPVHVAGSK